mmetsp:Transcript_45689/g.126797  ORF Transcript_45689/g.126797 Transcript_45689/m.126797 type:complete len:376 (+) Transcript_45689:72-1199(+)
MSAHRFRAVLTDADDAEAVRGVEVCQRHLVDHHRELYATLCPNVSVSAWNAALTCGTVVERIQSGVAFLRLIAPQDGKVRGYLSYQINSPHVQINHIVVVKEHRGQGFAGRLWNGLLQILAENAEQPSAGWDILLAVAAENSFAIGWYRRLGFLRMGSVPRALESGGRDPPVVFVNMRFSTAAHDALKPRVGGFRDLRTRHLSRIVRHGSIEEAAVAFRTAANIKTFGINHLKQNLLFFAVQRRDCALDMCHLLLDVHGVRATQVDSHGQTAMHWVATTGNVDCADLLVERRCDVNHIDCLLRQTPLFYAAHRGSASMVRRLLWLRADAGFRDKKGMSPRCWASCLENVTALLDDSPGGPEGRVVKRRRTRKSCP